MGIKAGDIRLVASQVMDDVPEGGGAPTARVIRDGASNAIFPDISEVARTGGRINLRKVFASVQTTDQESYFDANLIIAEPPQDPRVSVTLFSTKDLFDRRDKARSYVESYLAAGAPWNGYLLENHISGQRTITLLQPANSTLPAVGQTLVLSMNEGLGTMTQQYVRVTRAGWEARTFYDGKGDDDSYTRWVVTCEISDALRYNFLGSSPDRNVQNSGYGGKTRVRDTIVADAAKFNGVSKLVSAASMGDLSCQVESIFSAVVPSAQVDVPLLDVQPSQQITTLQAASGLISFSTYVAFSPTQSIYIGGGIQPKTLSIVIGATTLRDDNGRLYDGAKEVGAVDYANGVVTSASNTYGGSKTVSYRLAASPAVVAETAAIPVTAESRTATVVLTLESIPAPGTLQVSYMALGRWYVLRDQGSGTIRGSDASFGSGTLSFTTGTLAVTLGALPDVGSEIVLSWGPTAFAEPMPAASAEFFVALHAGQPLAAASVTVTWDDKIATDDGHGNLSGDATGTVDYATGEIELRPALIPAPGVTWRVAASNSAERGTVSSHALINLGTIREAVLGEAVIPGSFSAVVSYLQFEFSHQHRYERKVVDDGEGRLKVVTQTGSGRVLTTVGTIGYSDGTLHFDAEVILPSLNHLWTWQTLPGTSTAIASPAAAVSVFASCSTDMGVQSIQYNTASAAAGPAATGVLDTLSVRFNKLGAARVAPNSLRFTAGGSVYQDRLGHLLRDIDPATNAGVDVGTVDYQSAVVSLTQWPALTGTRARAELVAGLVQTSDMLTGNIAFRLPVAPLRPASLSFVVTARDGAQIIGGFDASGHHVSANAVGKCDYQTGIARVWFRDTSGTPGAANEVDLSGYHIPGVERIYLRPVYGDTIRFNATGYSYIPIDADIIGVDPVRLPQDGKVPIFRNGGYAVVGHSKRVSATVAAGQTIDCGRVRLSRVRVIGRDGLVINDGYSADLDAGTVTFADVSGYAQPVTIEHRIEDMVLLSDVQISGRVSFLQPLTHDYPAGSCLSSALMAGDLRARTSLVFDQQTWGNTWSDDLAGNTAPASYNDVLAPIDVTNKGAVTERWAAVFTSSSSFNIVGEHVGQIATGTINSDCAPINPAAGAPYFTLRALGWGSGWVAGNALRFNTVGALVPVWLVRTIQQGPETANDDSFTLLIRGDVDKP